MGDRVRIEVEDFGRRPGGVIVHVDLSVLGRLTVEQRDLLDRAIDRAVTKLRAAGVHDPVDALLAEAVRRHADQAAYQREAARRGVLAL